MNSNVYKVKTYDLDYQVLSTKVFMVRSKAEEYARQVRSEFLPNVGKVVLEHVNAV